MKKIVLIGDVVSSKKIADRLAFQNRLAAALKRLSDSNPNAASPYTITLGDEFQAVLHRADTMFHEIFSLLGEVHPEKIRFAVGIGDIDTPINPRSAIGMDGPAFHNARDAMEELERSSRLFGIAGLQGSCAEVTVHTLDLLFRIIGKWKKNRLRTLTMLIEGTAVSEISGKLGITEQAVYKTIRTGALENVVRVLGDVTEIVNRSLAGR